MINLWEVYSPHFFPWRTKELKHEYFSKLFLTHPSTTPTTTWSVCCTKSGCLFLGVPWTCSNETPTQRAWLCITLNAITRASALGNDMTFLMDPPLRGHTANFHFFRNQDCLTCWLHKAGCLATTKELERSQKKAVPGLTTTKARRAPCLVAFKVAKWEITPGYFCIMRKNTWLLPRKAIT